MITSTRAQRTTVDGKDSVIMQFVSDKPAVYTVSLYGEGLTKLVVDRMMSERALTIEAEVAEAEALASVVRARDGRIVDVLKAAMSAGKLTESEARAVLQYERVSP